jgi:hypothetical protein|tara:strand:+ start:1385 stop:1693 length:309 start_codon:yes stop_codon:yes gene_type:complete
MNIKKLIISIIFCLMCSTAYAEASKTEAEKAIQTAKELRTKTIAAGHEWNTLQPLIKKAEKALAAKDFSAAISFAQKASSHSESALKQAESEKTNWLLSVPK